MERISLQKQNDNYKKDGLRLKKTFLFFFILTTLFFSDKELIYKYYLPMPQTTLLLILFILIIIFVFMNGRIYTDSITLLLTLRLIIYLIPLLYIENIENYWGNYLSVIGSFIAYLISSQKQKRNISVYINKAVLIYLMIICFQVIITYVSLIAKMGSVNINLLKFYLVIPIGGSNYIAAIILPCIIFLYSSNISKFSKYATLFIALFTLLIIQSKNAIILLMLTIGLMILIRYFKSMKKYNEKNEDKWSYFVMTIVLLIIIASIVYFSIKYFLDKWYMGMSVNSASLYDFINAITSNRLDVYSKELSRWSEHLFFGNGLSYTIGYFRSHNWIIDLFVQVGVIGFVIFSAAIFTWYKKTVSYISKDKLVRSIFFFVLIMLAQGLGEVTLFTNTVDVLFWYMIGLSISQVNFINEKSIKEI